MYVQWIPAADLFGMANPFDGGDSELANRRLLCYKGTRMTPEQLDLVEKDIKEANEGGNCSVTVILRGLPEAVYGEYERISPSLITIYSGMNSFWIDVTEVAAIIVQRKR